MLFHFGCLEYSRHTIHWCFDIRGACSEGKNLPLSFSSQGKSFQRVFPFFCLFFSSSQTHGCLIMWTWDCHCLTLKWKIWSQWIQVFLEQKNCLVVSSEQSCGCGGATVTVANVPSHAHVKCQKKLLYPHLRCQVSYMTEPVKPYG